jgi:enamine deaminase RidA (YjgF/YER057c/UK114 family)
MTIRTLNFTGLPEPQGFTHAAIAEGTKLIFLAGQVGQDSEGNVAEGDLAAQMEQAMVNVANGLKEAGASFEDVAKITLYVVEWDESKLEALFTGFGRAAERIGTATLRPVTLIPVPRLFESAHLVEVDATAIID